jgi:DNA-binding MarR family transcriptional regulator
MQLTPEQQEQVRQAKAAGERRVYLRFTPKQRTEWRAAVEEELAAKEENIAHVRKIHAAAEQPGFSGDLRRAVLASGRPVHELAQQIGVERRLFSDFQAGEAELPSAALDRLVAALDLRLMQEIAR